MSGCRMTEAKPLTFNVVDGLAFAAAGGHLETSRTPSRYVPRRLGPLFEFLHLTDGGQLPADAGEGWLAPGSARAMLTALRQQRESWISPDGRRMGFIRAVRPDPDGNSRLTGFLMDAQRAARDVACLPGSAPGQLVGAMEEMENNIHEHCNAAGTGLLAFRAARSVFEFVVADRGIGILRSLRSCPQYSTLCDHGKALESALTDGISRFGTDRGRGHGFRPMFLGLANLTGSLRFRSGDHAVVIDGTSPTLMTAQLAQKPPLDGFFASVSCSAR